MSEPLLAFIIERTVIVVHHINSEISGLAAGINSFHASGDFCLLLITFANSLDPDQDRQNVGPDLDPNCLTL